MNEPRAERVVMDAAAIRRAIQRMARELMEQVGTVQGLALVGIHTAGVPLAARLAAAIAADEGQAPAVGMIDIALYRDDVLVGLPHPVVGRTSLPFEVDGAQIVLVDDVLYTGRTIRAALDALVDYGRPKRVLCATLIDRGHRELPIQGDFVGLRVGTDATDLIRVALTELGHDADEVVLRMGQNLGQEGGPA